MLPLFGSSAAAETFARQGRDSVEVADTTVTDVDGNVYRTVTIGTQVWMAENLKVTRYGNGRVIPNVVEEDVWSQLTTGAYCLVDNDSVNYKNTYGVLYNYYAVADSCGLCPEGWHVPTRTEWQTLENLLGGQAVAGGKLKETGTAHWNDPNIGATNESGFSGLPAGGRGRFGPAGDVGDYATWWSSTEHDSIYAWHWGLYRVKPETRRNPGHKTSGFSVRCIQD
jgi:uncharacterized protein (TIGR02145 family)